MHARPSEKVALIACIDPDSYDSMTIDTAATEGDVIDMSKWHEVMVVLSVGTMESGATVNLDVESGATTTANTTTVKSIEQLTEAGSDGDSQVILNVRSDEIDDSHRYLNVEVTIGVDSVDLCCHVFGLEPRFASPTDPNDVDGDDDLSSVVEIVE